MNLLKEYLRTTNFPYSIIKNNQVIEKDSKNLLDDKFNAQQFIQGNGSQHLLTIYKDKLNNLYCAAIKHVNVYYLIGPVIVNKGQTGTGLTPPPAFSAFIYFK